jgi:hypothetical protein
MNNNEKLSYERWKEINKCCRNPRFTSSQLDKFGISDDEWETYSYSGDYRERLNREDNRKGCLLVLSIFVGIPALLFAFMMSLAFGSAMIDTHFRQQSIEHMTGHHVDFWDVYWEDHNVRINTTLK